MVLSGRLWKEKQQVEKEGAKGTQGPGINANGSSAQAAGWMQWTPGQDVSDSESETITVQCRMT